RVAELVTFETSPESGIMRTSGTASPVAGIAPQVLERLALQAATQVASEREDRPAVQVCDAAALAAIPPPNPGDLFFDFEGDPLFREPGDDEHARWGIDYVFGIVDTSEQFSALWAH